MKGFEIFLIVLGVLLLTGLIIWLIVMRISKPAPPPPRPTPAPVNLQPCISKMFLQASDPITADSSFYDVAFETTAPVTTQTIH